MATNSKDQGEEPEPVDSDEWSQADQDAAKHVEQRCGIALVPDGVDN